MKIRQVSCEQFAGLRDRELAFTDGLNLIIGDNESGKSTIAELIYQLLFKDAQLDARRDSAFMDRFFPHTVSGKGGSVIDGTIRIGTEDGVYKISKEWEKGAGSVKLTSPEGDICKGAEAEDILSKLLIYGRGVYDEVIFSSQKRQLRAVEMLLKNAGERKRSGIGESLQPDLAAVLTQAVMDTGGVSVERLGKNLAETLIRYEARWDFAADLPEGGIKRGIGNKWRDATTREADAGRQALILRAWYDMKDAEAQRERAQTAEEAVEACKDALRKAKIKRDEAVQAQKTFQKNHTAIERQNLLAERLSDRMKTLQEMEQLRDLIPGIEADLQKALRLQTALAQAEVREKYDRVRKLHDSLEQKQKELSGIREVPAEKIREAEKLMREADRIDAALSGLDLTARIRKLSDTPVEVRTAAGKQIDYGSDGFDITEAVEIRVPGIMEMDISPRGIDLAETTEKRKKLGTALDELLAAYQVKDIDALREQRDRYDREKSAAEKDALALESALAGEEWEALVQRNAQIPADIASYDSCREEMEAAFGKKAPDRVIGELEAKMKQFSEKYTSMDELHAQIRQCSKDIDEIRAGQREAEEIPEEYRGIRDPRAFLDQLEEDVQACEVRVEEAQERLTETERGLPEQSAEEYADAVRGAQDIFEARKAEYAHWKHIAETFEKVKAAFGTAGPDSSGGIAGLSQSFRKNLEILTDGKLKLTSLDESFESRIASGNNALTYEILSAGTMDTISLAFRLAMLNCLFPEGGGLAVFDDPFTEMDEKRTEQACALLKEFAKNNQVIFITCDTKYSKLLEGEIHRVG